MKRARLADSQSASAMIPSARSRGAASPGLSSRPLIRLNIYKAGGRINRALTLIGNDRQRVGQKAPAASFNRTDTFDPL
jgi:hypothetical protein